MARAQALLVRLPNDSVVGWHNTVEKLFERHGDGATVISYLFPDDSPLGDGSYVKMVEQTDASGATVKDESGHVVREPVALPQPKDVKRERDEADAERTRAAAERKRSRKKNGDASGAEDTDGDGDATGDGAGDVGA